MSGDVVTINPPIERVLHVSTATSMYGGERQVLLLVRGLREHGIASTVCAARKSPLATELRGSGCDVVEIDGRGVRAIRQVRDAIKSARPDVVHTHDGHAAMTAGLASVGLRRSGCVRTVIASRRFAGRTSRLKYGILFDGVHAISDAVAEYVRRSGIAPERIVVARSGVDAERVRGGDRSRGRDAAGVPDDAKMVLLVGSLVEAKGHQDLIDAMHRLRSSASSPSDESPATQIHAVVAGDGPLESALRASAASAGLADCIHFIGRTEAVADLFAASDVVAIPSRFEGLSTTAMDAMLAATAPIVATAIGGIPEVLGPRDAVNPSAIFIEARNPASLAAGIERALAGGHEITAMIDAARTRAEQAFSVPAMMRGMMSMYANFLRAGRKRQPSRRSSD